MTAELSAILSAGLPSQDDAAKLSGILYNRCYIRCILDPAEEVRPVAADLTGILAAANRGRAIWVEGWRIEQVLDDGRIVARRNGTERAFQPGEYITHRGIGAGPKEGAAIVVYVAPGSSELQESFYHAMGESVADFESQSVVRIYWNIQAEGAPRLMESLTREFNRYQIPFRFKCLNNASHFPRRDAAVLYIESRFYPIAARLVESIHRDVLPWLNAGTPLFARRLGHGLALAEHPGDSFGKHRCEILAAAMAASQGSPVEDRLAEVRRHFEQRGLSWDAPWLNANSSGAYEYPVRQAKAGLDLPGERISHGEPLEVAHRIGARLCRDALWSGGRCNWTGPEREGEHSLAYHSLGPLIYSGTSGVALFLWRLAQATGDRIVRQTAEGALRQARSRMPYAGCGLYVGGLGILFAAAEMSGECDEEAIVRQAAPDPATLDLLGGSAGAIGALVHFNRTRGGSRWLDAAAAHGDLLLAEAVRADEGWSWRTYARGARNLTGFSHGTAGIAWALLELWAATGEARFRAAALEAFRYERSCFSPTHRNWPDFRKPEIAYPAVWCHGAGGIGFSRLRAWQLLGDDEFAAEARTAIGTVAATLDGGGNFSLCHGVAGNADLLLYASQVLNEPEWHSAAQRVGRDAAARYERRSAPWPCGVMDAWELPALMTGTAGIGYFYLRLADPVNVPSALIVGGS
jgi:hypothetical protein